MKPDVSRITSSIERKLRGAGPPSPGRLLRTGHNALRILYAVVSGINDEPLKLRAMSLVYSTLLSIVPLLAVSFSVLKAFGVHTRFEILLYYFLEPLGDRGVDLSMQAIAFVENVNVGVLGSIGLTTLMYTVVSQVQKIESALNDIWQVRAARGFTKRFNNYLSVLLVGPVIVFSAAGAAASLMKLEVMKELMEIRLFGPAISAITSSIPYALACLGFGFVYLFLPNTRVRFSSALTGGVFAGLIWAVTGRVFTFLVVSPAQYSAIYSGFAVIILSLIWLYWSFLIFLSGGRVAFYHQHPAFIPSGRAAGRMSGRLREKAGLAAMFLIGRNFYFSKKAWQTDSLAAHLGLPAPAVLEIISILEENRMVVASHDEPPAYFPARDIGTIRIWEVVETIRLHGEENLSGREKLRLPLPVIEEMADKISAHMADSLGGLTVRDLVLSEQNKDTANGVSIS